MRLEPNFIVDRSPKEKLKSARVKGKFKVMSRIMMKRERRLGFSHQKQFQLSPILNSFLEFSVHGNNSASGASLGKSNPSDDDTTAIKQDLACFQLQEQEDNGFVDDKVIGLPPGYGQLHKCGNVNSEFNACKLFDKRSQLEGLFSERMKRMLADAVVAWLLSKVLTPLSFNFQEWYPDDKFEKLTEIMLKEICLKWEPEITAVSMNLWTIIVRCSFNMIVYNFVLTVNSWWESEYLMDKLRGLLRNEYMEFEENGRSNGFEFVKLGVEKPNNALLNLLADTFTKTEKKDHEISSLASSLLVKSQPSTMAMTSKSILLQGVILATVLEQKKIVRVLLIQLGEVYSKFMMSNIKSFKWCPGYVLQSGIGRWDSVVVSCKEYLGKSSFWDEMFKDSSEVIGIVNLVLASAPKFPSEYELQQMWYCEKNISCLTINWILHSRYCPILNLSIIAIDVASIMVSHFHKYEPDNAWLELLRCKLKEIVPAFYLPDCISVFVHNIDTLAPYGPLHIELNSCDPVDDYLKQYLLKHDVKIFQNMTIAGFRVGKEPQCKAFLSSRIYTQDRSLTFKEMVHLPKFFNETRLKGTFVTSVYTLVLSTCTLFGLSRSATISYVAFGYLYYDDLFSIFCWVAFVTLLTVCLGWSPNLSIVISILEGIHGTKTFSLAIYASIGNEWRGFILPGIYIGYEERGNGIVAQISLFCFVFVKCDSLLKQPENFLKSSGELGSLVGWNNWQGSEVVHGIAALKIILAHVTTALDGTFVAIFRMSLSLKLEVKLQLKRGGDVRIPILTSTICLTRVGHIVNIELYS